MEQGKVDVLLGLQWGDEGKGKVVGGPPWGIPISVLSNIPFTSTPALRYLCINEITLPSLMVLDSTSISLLMFTVSKNFSKSISTTYTLAIIYILLALSEGVMCSSVWAKTKTIL